MHHQLPSCSLGHLNNLIQELSEILREWEKSHTLAQAPPEMCQKIYLPVAGQEHHSGKGQMLIWNRWLQFVGRWVWGVKGLYVAWGKGVRSQDLTHLLPVLSLTKMILWFRKPPGIAVRNVKQWATCHIHLHLDVWEDSIEKIITKRRLPNLKGLGDS